YARAGSAGGLSSRLRLASRGAGAAAKVVFPRAQDDVSDPMSGFFAVRTAAVCPGDLRPRGFKILLEVLVRTPGLRVAEVPFTFAERHDGQSKASAREAARYLRQLACDRWLYRPRSAGAPPRSHDPARPSLDAAGAGQHHRTAAGEATGRAGRCGPPGIHPRRSAHARRPPGQAS